MARTAASRPTAPEKLKRAPIATAPRDGSLVRVALWASEQGPAELDTVRWARSASSGEEGWVAFDSDPEARIVYSDSEIAYWLPLPSQAPSRRPSPPSKATPDTDESDGSAI